MSKAYLEAGIDYLTMTMEQRDLTKPYWYYQCLDCIQMIEDSGNKAYNTRLIGYEGINCGPAFAGENDTSAMFRVSGPWAHKVFFRTFMKTAHYSRLDLQVTYVFSRYQKDIGKKAYQAVENSNKTLSAARRRKCRLVGDNDGGQTCYIGSRSSDTFARIYNKDAQSKEEKYRNSWRYEVETHNNAATGAAEALSLANGTSSHWVANFVHRWCTSRGISVPFKAGDTQAILPPSRQPETNVETKLRWLQSQVAPSIKYLQQHVPDAILYEALGLLPSHDTLDRRKEKEL